MELAICLNRLPIILLALLLCSSGNVVNSLLIRKRALRELAESLPELRAMSPRSEHPGPSDGNQFRASVVKAEDFTQQNIDSHDLRTGFNSYLGQNTHNWYYASDLWQHYHYWKRINGLEDAYESPLLLTQWKMRQWGHVLLADFAKNMIAENDYRVELFYNWLKARFPSEAATFAPRNFYNLQDLLWNFVIWARANSHLFPQNSRQAQSIVNALTIDSVVKTLLQWAETERLYEYDGGRISNSVHQTSEAALGYPAASYMLPLHVPTLKGPNSRYFETVVERVEPNWRKEFREYMDRKAKRIGSEYDPSWLDVSDLNTLYDRWEEKHKLKHGSFFDRIHYRVRKLYRKLSKWLNKHFHW